MQIKTETTVGIFILIGLIAFLYMTLQIGVFRLDSSRYCPYIACFKDVAGLTKKADIKIAGVKVGWVDGLELNSDGTCVKANLMILKDYVLHVDAQAHVRQEGLLGPKFVDLAPGTFDASQLIPGDQLKFESNSSMALDDVLQSFTKVASNIESVTGALKNGLNNSSCDIPKIIEAISKMAQQITTTSQALEKITGANGQESTIEQLAIIVRDLKDKLPHLTHELTSITSKLNSDILPRVVDVVENTSKQACQSLKSVNGIAQKINNGEGLLGKVVNDSECYENLKCVTQNLRTCFDTLRGVGVTLDSHFESLHSIQDKCKYQDSKLYINARVYPSPDYFFLAGFTFSQKGYLSRKAFNYTYADECNKQLLPSALLKDHNFDGLVARKEVVKEKFNAFSLNLQVAKICGNAALRLGMFEGSAGFALDYLINFKGGVYKWLSTLEAFDSRGKNRLFKDTKPHLKWINKVLFTPNIYLAFGLDDFVSKYNKNAFIGIGIRFADEDIKNLFTRPWVQ